MNAGFQTTDYLVFGVYALVIVIIGLYISRFSKEKSSSDYFLAGRSLSWWAIGASLIAANISAEQFIGMSGSGFRIGIGIAAYEWIAAATLILVAKYLLPIMIEKRIYTMPQLLNERYGHGVSIAFSIFFLLLYLFVNLTSVAWLGALAMEQVLGIPMMWGVVGLLLFSGLYSIYGGLKAVVWTDIIQVVFLIGGGLVAVYFALKAADPSTAVMADGSAWTGLQNVFRTIRDAGGDYHLSMIIPEGTVVSDPATGQQFDISKDLPGLALLLGSIWVTNIGFWGFNQYIIQKGLAARSLHEAKKGLLFAGYLKLLIPLIVVIPGITAYVLFTNPQLIHGLQDSISTADSAYPWLLKNFTPTGIKGLAFAALVAAIVSSLASMINSTATIFTMDIYKRLIAPAASEKRLVNVGRTVAFCALFIAMAAAKPLLGGLDQAFQYIQEYSGYVYPGVTVVFGMGLLWKKATNRAALWTSILTIPVGIALKFAYPEMAFVGLCPHRAGRHRRSDLAAGPQRIGAGRYLGNRRTPLHGRSLAGASGIGGTLRSQRDSFRRTLGALPFRRRLHARRSARIRRDHPLHQRHEPHPQSPGLRHRRPDLRFHARSYGRRAGHRHYPDRHICRFLVNGPARLVRRSAQGGA